jgi:uncharacterized DUF497 family protein
VTFEWDEAKRARNRRKHGADFDAAADFDWSGALVVEDQRRAYGERRFRALGLIGDRLHHIVFTVRGDAVRIISLRKANTREVAGYEAQS